VAASRRSGSRDVVSYCSGTRDRDPTEPGGVVGPQRDVLKIMVDSSGTPVQLGSQIDFFQRYGAHLTATPKDTIQFDPRGFAVGVTTVPKFLLALGASPIPSA